MAGAQLASWQLGGEAYTLRREWANFDSDNGLVLACVDVNFIEKKVDKLVEAPPAGSDIDFPRLSQGACFEAYNDELREMLRATLDSEMFYLQLTRYRLRDPFSALWCGPVLFWRTQRERRTRMDVCHS